MRDHLADAGCFSVRERLKPRFFSDQEDGERRRDLEVINEDAWSGIFEYIKEQCGDTESFWRKAKSLIPIGKHIFWDDDTNDWGKIIRQYSNYRFINSDGETLATSAILDLVVFSHHYLENEFDRQRILREEVNWIFARNGLAFELREDSEIYRLSSQVLFDALRQAIFATGDGNLDKLLEDARVKFLDPDEAVRREALEKLWDAFERLKTLEPGKDKRTQASALLDRVADAPLFRTGLDREAKELTDLGNQLHIRHTETTQEEIRTSEHIDYLFHRLFAFVRLVLRTTGRGG